MGCYENLKGPSLGEEIRDRVFDHEPCAGESEHTVVRIGSDVGSEVRWGEAELGDTTTVEVGGEVTDQLDAATGAVAEPGECRRGRRRDRGSRNPSSVAVCGVAGGTSFDVERTRRPVVGEVQFDVSVGDDSPGLHGGGVELEVRLPHLVDVSEVQGVVPVGLADAEVGEVVGKPRHGVRLHRPFAGTNRCVVSACIVDRAGVDLAGVLDVHVRDLVQRHAEDALGLRGTSTGGGCRSSRSTDRNGCDDRCDDEHQCDEQRLWGTVLDQVISNLWYVRCNGQGDSCSSTLS